MSSELQVNSKSLKITHQFQVESLMQLKSDLTVSPTTQVPKIGVIGLHPKWAIPTGHKLSFLWPPCVQGVVWELWRVMNREAQELGQ